MVAPYILFKAILTQTHSLLLPDRVFHVINVIIYRMTLLYGKYQQNTEHNLHLTNPVLYDLLLSKQGPKPMVCSQVIHFFVSVYLQIHANQLFAHGYTLTQLEVLAYYNTNMETTHGNTASNQYILKTSKAALT